jgi:hypothetical protein
MDQSAIVLIAIAWCVGVWAYLACPVVGTSETTSLDALVKARRIENIVSWPNGSGVRHNEAGQRGEPGADLVAECVGAAPARRS